MPFATNPPHGMHSRPKQRASREHLNYLPHRRTNITRHGIDSLKFLRRSTYEASRSLYVLRRQHFFCRSLPRDGPPIGARYSSVLQCLLTAAAAGRGRLQGARTPTNRDYYIVPGLCLSVSVSLSFALSFSLPPFCLSVIFSLLSAMPVFLPRLSLLSIYHMLYLSIYLLVLSCGFISLVFLPFGRAVNVTDVCAFVCVCSGAGWTWCRRSGPGSPCAPSATPGSSPSRPCWASTARCSR